MKVLIVTGKYPTAQRPGDMVFVKEQVEALKEAAPGLQIDVYNYEGFKGKMNYLKAICHIRRIAGEYDLIHAHYGLSGTIAVFQYKKPVITTYHGSDLMLRSHRLFSYPAMKRSFTNIVVAPHLVQKAMGEDYSVIPSGVDFKAFFPMNRAKAKNSQGLDIKKKYILFPGDPKDPVRNYPLFKAVVELLDNPHLEILTLVNTARQELNEILNAAEVMVLTSFRAGSPQVVKEAIRCHLPVVSLDVGDVKGRLQGLEGSEVVGPEPAGIAAAIKRTLERGKRPDYSSVWDTIDNKMVAQKVLALYNNVKQQYN